VTALPPVPDGGAAPGTGPTPRPRLLDLFCCAGGAADGYAAAGFEVVGVDKNPQPNYPYRFIQENAIGTLAARDFLATFDAIHASPPCQRYTRLRHRYTENRHPDLIDVIRPGLIASRLPYVIENVEDARGRLRDPVMLCGTMFDGLRVSRHRYFETSFPLTAPRSCPGRHPLHYTLDKRKAHYGRLDEWTAFVSVNGGGNCSRAAAADAMGLAHRYLTKGELNEAIPPAYTRHIGEALMGHLRQEAAA